MLKWLIVHSLCNQLPSELTLDSFNILHTCYRPSEHVHEEVLTVKKIFFVCFLQPYRVFNLAIFDNWIFSTLCRYVTDVWKMCIKKIFWSHSQDFQLSAGGIK